MLGAVFAAVAILSYLSKKKTDRETVKKDQDAADRRACEEMMRPHIKRHEAEKKRWEDDYWKQREKRDTQE